jgi:Flp pilus assembly protein TadG
MGGRRVSTRARRGEEGQSLVELALYLPMMTIFIFACFQFAVIFYDYLSVMNAARDIGRWLVVHPHTVDATSVAAIRARLPSNLDPASLTISVSPTCTALNASGKCPSRPQDAQLAVTFNYDVRSHMFLPRVFGFGGLQVTFPTALPAYTLYMVVEPN